MTCLLWDPMVKITGATIFLSTVCMIIALAVNTDAFLNFDKKEIEIVIFINILFVALLGDVSRISVPST